MRGQCWKYCLIISILFSVVAQCASGDSEALGDKQVWPSVGIAWDVNGPWMLQFRETYYMNAGGSSANSSDFDIGGVYKGYKDKWDLGFGYHRLVGRNQNDGSINENRPYIHATVRGKLFDISASNRFMLEYRDFANKSDCFRFRNKITLNSPFENLDTRGIRLLNRERVKPYIADEVFFNSNGQGFSQNRVYLGIQIKIMKNIGANLYYMLQTLKKDDQWQNNNIIGFDLTFSF